MIDLAAHPATCVRLDVDAVYLGSQGPAPGCPAHVVGRGTTLQLETIDSSYVSLSDPVRRDVSGVPALIARGTRISKEVIAAFPKQGVVATLRYAKDRAGALQILESVTAHATLDPYEARANERRLVDSGSSADAEEEQPVAGPVIVTQEGFDACTAPSTETMQAWLESPYRSVGVYIGGVSRGCAQPNLTPEWVSAVLAQGWSLIPTYVGLQAPCSQYANRVDPATASAQGIQQADDAANAAAALGFRAGSPIYFDMEHFDTTAEGCTEAVLTFLESWTEQLHVRGFTSGVYSSASSGIAELANANAADPSYVEPDAIWFAWWNNVADTKGTKYFTDDMWTNHQRLHQYRGGGQETYGGVTINIDRDYLDGPVVGATSSEPVPPERHSRSVDLSLTEGRRRLLVDGRVRVSGGFASCVDRVPVKIQRRADGPWNTIARRTTTSAGRFDARLRLRRGRYRAVAPRTSSPTDICLTAASAALRFRPS